jgi:hypothetical protein
VDLLGRAYANFQNCDYQNSSDFNTDDTVGFSPSNVPMTALGCAAPTAGVHFRPQNSLFFAGDLKGKRYVNFGDCDAVNLTDNNTDDETKIAPSMTPINNPLCNAAAPGTAIRPQNSSFDPLDLYDPTRGQGYIEFKMTAPQAPGLYTENGSLSGGNFAASADQGQIEVRASGTPACQASILGQYDWHGVLYSQPGVDWHHSMTITSYNPATGAFSGNGYWVDGPATTWNVTGTVTGSAFSAHIVYTNVGIGYTADAIGSVGTNGNIAGTIVDSPNRAGTFAATKLQPANCPVTPVTPQCQDGIDNDGDGATDFPADFSCSSADDNDETNTKSQCQDGIDNDQDGLVDYPQDPGCSSKQDNTEFSQVTPTLPACSDGLDNDNDGKTDFFDAGCYPNNVFNPALFNPNDTDESNAAALCRWMRVQNQWVRSCA